MKKLLSNKKGFTLIELVVVIVILGILMLLIIPRIGKFQDNAEVKTCKGNQRTLGSAQAMYYSVYGSTAATLDGLSEFTGAYTCPAGGTYRASASDPYIFTCNGSSNGLSHENENAT